MYTERQSIEIFHLLFLKVLKNHLDSDMYAIKGGCNLRFFFESIRYSEDIDIDINIIAKHTLKKKIDTILNSTPLRHSLAFYQLSIDNISSPKQTDTVQRWKVGIRSKNGLRSIPTKIEFSRRELDQERKAEIVQNFILQEYRLQPLILPHYVYFSAVKQKIQALIFRTETQARDIFDLNHLFSKNEATLKINFDLQKAIDCVLSISFNDYRSQVVSYLTTEYIEHFDSKKIWEEMQLFVIDSLNKVNVDETH